MNSALPVTNTSLGGHLRLECSARPDGMPFLSKQDFRVPVHIGKGRVDQGVMVLNIANPTAGFFDGDRVDIDVTVRSGASLCLSTPAWGMNGSGFHSSSAFSPTVNRGWFAAGLPERVG